MMKEKRWITLVLSAAFLLAGNLAFALNMGGSARYNYSESANFQDGQKTSESNGLTQNYNFTLSNEITPLSSYSFSVQSNLNDSESIDSEGNVSKSHGRRITPGLDFNLSNPMYSIGMGYRRQEQWTTKDFSDESRKTNESFYNRLGLSPYLLPSLSLQFDRSKQYDHLPVQKTDTTSTRYSLGSSYTLPSKDINMSMNFNLSRGINESPLSNIKKTISDSLGSGYNISHSSQIFPGFLIAGFNYSGSYSQSVNKQFVNVRGDVLLERMSLGGLHTTGSVGNENIGVLSSEVALVDDNFNAPTSIDLNADRYHNIGIWVSSQKFVEKIYIYVNRDISGDATLAAAGSWRVYRSDFNQDNTWTLLTINSVNITAFDPANNVYRYEIEFASKQKAAYFKVVNMDLSDVASVLVTEIEAYGLENIPDTNIITTKTESLGQRINVNISVIPLKKLRFGLYYTIDRSDSNLESLEDSFLGIFQDIVSKDTEESEGSVTGNITKGYGITSSWDVHKLLSSNFRVSRSENYNKEGTTDTSSNAYGISLNSSPLPTIGSSLSLTRSDRFEFDEKKSTGNSAVISLSLKLYEKVDMIQDMGYTSSKSFENDSETKSYNMGGSLNIKFTPKLSENIGYSVTWKPSGDTTAVSRNIATNVTYRPGRLVNISANFSISDSNGEISSAQSFSADWLPLKRLRLNFSYNHENSADSTKSDRVSIFSKWNITKSIDTQISYAYSMSQKNKVNETQALNMNMNGRF
ncbi:MAG: hypothetical protein ABFR82_09950 [Nitrospirota bacterium]